EADLAEAVEAGRRGAFGSEDHRAREQARAGEADVALGAGIAFQSIADRLGRSDLHARARQRCDEDAAGRACEVIGRADDLRAQAVGARGALQPLRSHRTLDALIALRSLKSQRALIALRALKSLRALI